MTLSTHQAWLKAFYQHRDWYHYSPFVHLNFMTEEVGEVSRAVRAIEIGRDHPGEAQRSPQQLQDNLQEELADVLDQVLMLASKFDLDADDLLTQSERKLTNRFHNPSEQS